ncbi:MAG: FAD-dependent oxidoreductase [Oscillospiraceae bacterium]|jgi:2,4-dienoyl-CoA reductase-like NADH-dependent reductase (Old Yellow Enzyme family)/thioredoxin reductase|nr:FAD-dependent oxidoreductase [Oscillospiraceae bacterium]
MGSDYKHCFTPITVKGVEFKNRIVVTPNIAGWGTREGVLTQEQSAYFERFARGGAALVTLGNCSINMNESSDEIHQLDLSHDKVIFGLNVLRERCARYNAHLSAQINYAGRNGWYPGSVHYAPSPLPTFSEMENAEREGRYPKRVHEIDCDKLRELIEGYANAALRLKRAGFKVLMLHCAHNNLIGQFFSPISNFRRDQYGGSLENRARFGIETLRAIRQKVGGDMIIDARMSGEDVMPGGLQAPEAAVIAQMLEPYVDIFTISCAFHMAPSYVQEKMSLAMYTPQMPLIEYTKQFRSALKHSKLTFTTSVVNLDNAEFVLENDMADFVGMFRPFLADPDIVSKYSRNRAGDVNTCIRCEWHGRFFTHLPMGCAVNPYCGRELEYPKGRVAKTDAPRKVMVIGGGPAGMQAAWTAAQRGHDVVLYEKEEELGGNLLKASRLPFKREIEKFTGYITPRVTDSGARIVLGVEADEAAVEAEKPDVLILALGCEDVRPGIPGARLEHVRFAHEADSGAVKPGKNVVIIGAGHVGTESAIQLARDGHTVAVLEADPAGVCMEKKGSLAAPLSAMSRDAGVRFFYECTAEEIRDGSVVYRDMATGRVSELPCDTVLLAVGLRPRRELAERLRHTIAECDVYLVGDLTESGAIGHAVNSGFDIAAHI